jgi:hypothetical protein
MQAAAASISSHVAAAKGGFCWHWYLNRMSALVLLPFLALLLILCLIIPCRTNVHVVRIFCASPISIDLPPFFLDCSSSWSCPRRALAIISHSPHRPCTSCPPITRNSPHSRSRPSRALVPGIAIASINSCFSKFAESYDAGRFVARVARAGITPAKVGSRPSALIVAALVKRRKRSLSHYSFFMLTLLHTTLNCMSVFGNNNPVVESWALLLLSNIACALPAFA